MHKKMRPKHNFVYEIAVLSLG